MKRYKFKRSINSIIWSTLHLVAVAVVGTAIYLKYDGSLFFVWFALCAAATILLMTLSIPRDVVVNDYSLNIHCVLEVTHIKLDDIVSVRRVPSKTIRWVIPLFAGCGFFGYYGIFFDYKHMRMFKMYGGEWRNIIEIVDREDGSEPRTYP